MVIFQQVAELLWDRFAKLPVFLGTGLLNGCVGERVKKMNQLLEYVLQNTYIRELQFHRDDKCTLIDYVKPYITPICYYLSPNGLDCK